MTDVLLFNTNDGGDIEVENGRFTMADGIETAAYLSFFGGNERDSGLQDGDPLQWWGNLGETDPARRYRSEVQHLIESLPAIPANLQRLEDAGTRDIAWMVEGGFATFARVDASMPALNTVQLDVSVEINGEIFEFRFTRPWRTSA